MYTVYMKSSIIYRLLSTVRPINPFTITDSCAKKIISLKSYRLRISVDAGGCSGFQYSFFLEPVIPSYKPELVVVDDQSVEFLKGCTVDYVTNIIKSGFVVTKNPLAESACGRGSSFARKNFGENKN